MAARNVDQNGMWTPYKELLAMVEMVVGHNKSEYLSDLETYLTRYRRTIIALLENPEKNPQQREELKKAPKSGIQIEGSHGLTKLSASFVKEALSLSDSLNLSEFSCLDLLLSAEQQLSHFPGLSRGLVAALLYHDGRRCLLSALKLLITGREGISWRLELDEHTHEVINAYTEKLFNDGVLSKVLQKLREINVQAEIEKLDQSKSVGNAKHRKQLVELITEQRNLLADCLFCWACQSPFGKRECLAVIDFLKDCIPNTSDGAFDHVTLKTVMSLIASWGTAPYEALVEEPAALEHVNFPVFKDTDVVTDLHQAIIRPDTQHWRTPSIKTILQFSWSVLLRVLSQFPNLDSLEEIFEEDEELLNVSIESDAFRFLKSGIVAADTFMQEEYCIKAVHTLVTTLIVKYPLKTKELRNRGDENARILQAHLAEGIDPPKGLRHDFQDLMILIGELYKSDHLGLELCLDYWCPNEPFGSLFSPKPVSAYKQALVQRQVLLNKFVRLAGDLIPQAMFTAYVKMLTGLSSNCQAAQYCFNLLSADGNIGRSPACSASWDHFFHSFKQYYTSLKQDPYSADHVAHVHHHQNISPSELSALESVLELIKTLAEHSENVRIAFCDNQSWLPIASFFGLVGCPIPSTLKAGLLDALASFAKSPEICTVLWQSLEATQLLKTVTQSQSGAQEAGIKIELEEIEARNETYPQTLAFMKLITRLTDITLPTTLGAGYRVPGFGPYLEFLRDNVFLKFKGRAYQDGSEKWMVASAVLEIFVKILANYEPLPEHFIEQDVEIQGVSFGRASKPPGYEIMIHLLNDTPMFRLVMNIIDILGKDIDESLGGKKSNEEKSVLHCMKLIECVLEKQMTFIAMLRDQNSSVLVTPMDRLLLSINPSTAEADYPYKIARYMAMNNVMPELSLAVVRILRLISQSTDIQSEIIGTLASKKVESEQLLVGFCEHLENEIPEETTEGKEGEDDEDAHESESTMRNAIRQSIVSLLLSTLQQPSPNIAQFLLGFDLQKSISKTIFQDAGIAKFPKTCFHSIISLLNRGLEAPNGPACISETPKLAELLYQLIYFLCAHTETGAPCQRYLRTNHDFFVSHASKMPFVRQDLLQDGNNELFVLLSNQQSWLLKTIAIEVKMASQTRLRSSMTRILDALYGQQTAQPSGTVEPFRGMKTQQSMLNTSSLLATPGTSLGRSTKDTTASNLISAILVDLELAQEYPTPFTSNMFDLSAVENLIASCESKSEDTGVIICDVKILHRLIMAELNNAQGMANMGQRPEILKEVKNILQHAIERNMIRRALGAKRQAFESWRQVVETSFAICQLDVFPGESREAVILDLLHETLIKVSDESAIAELISPVAGSILMLMAQYHSIVVQRASQSGTGGSQMSVDMSQLLTIFQGIVNCLTIKGASHWKTRCSLYGAILYYMQIGKLQTSVSEERTSDAVLSSLSKESWEANTLSFLAKHGESFMDMVCRDACDGPEIGEMLAFSVLDSIVNIDWQGRWTSFLSSRGYLRHLVDSISNDDVTLQTVFSSDADALKTIYSFESKLGFLTRFAQGEIGAQILLQSGIATKLIDCHFLDQRPEASGIGMQLSKLACSMNYDPLSPSKVEQYRVVFTSVLKLMQAIVSSLGPTHDDALNQIQQIVLSHEETFLSIVQGRSLHHTLDSLQELALVTSVVCLFKSKDGFNDPETVTDDNKRTRSFLAKMQRVLLALMQTFASKEYCKEIIKNCVDRADNGEVLDHLSLLSEVTSAKANRILLQVRANLISYARGVVSSSGLTGAYCNVVFAPSLIDINKRKVQDIRLKPAENKKISMGVLVEELDHATEELMTAITSHKKHSRRMGDIDDMSTEEMLQLLSQEHTQDVDRLSTHQRKLIAQKILQQLIDLSDDQACLNIQIIENILYILWRHIEYYFIHCEPVEVNDFELDLPKTPTVRARRLQDVTLQLDSSFSSKTKQTPTINMGKYSVSKEEIKQLQIEAKSVLTDKLMKKVLETESAYGKAKSRVGFTSAMVRRIQGLVKLHSS